MVALWAARVEDLQLPRTEISVEAIRPKLPGGGYLVLDLHLKVRCEKCGMKGRAMVQRATCFGARQLKNAPPSQPIVGSWGEENWS
jgi:hypothetical protein